MATRKQIYGWSDEARRYAYCAVVGYLTRMRHTHPELARDRADDAAQEALQRVLARCDPQRFANKLHFCRTVARAAINWATSEYGRKGVLMPLDDFDPADGSDDTEADDRLDLLRTAMAALPAADREVLRLSYEENLTLAEIAEQQGRTVNQVWYQLNRVREELKEAIKRGL